MPARVGDALLFARERAHLRAVFRERFDDAAKPGIGDIRYGADLCVSDRGGDFRLPVQYRDRTQSFNTNGSWTSSPSSHQTLFVWRYSPIDSIPFARPMPLCL